MKIKSGWGDKELQIRINAREKEESAECWIEFFEKNPPMETLSYITLDELVKLKREIDKAIQEMVK